MCYQNGISVEKDLNKAFEHYSKAAEKKFVTAQYNLGLCYQNGEGVKQNYRMAVQWFKSAADKGFAYAQYT